MNRRNVLIGLGGLVAGGGALVSTGAFDTVEAERTVSVETAGDAEAFLALEPAERDVADGEDENAFVEETDGTIEITFGDDDGATGGGLNLNARTVFDDLFVIRNQGTQTVSALTIGFVEDDPLVDTVEFSYVMEDDGGNGFGEAEFERDPGGTLSQDLEPGDEIIVGIEFDLIDSGIEVDDFDLTAEITAEA